MDITTSELIAELTRAAREADAPDGSITTGDIMESTGWGIDKTRRLLRRMVKRGEAKVVRSRRARVDGIAITVTAYVFLKPKAKVRA